MKATHVLSVMDAACSALEPVAADMLAKARVDVSELIDSITAFDIPASPMTPRLRRVRDALDRAQGGGK